MIARNGLILRPLDHKDIPFLYKWINDPNIMPYWYGKDKPRSMGWVKKHCEKIVSGVELSLCFIIEIDGKPIGFMYNTPEKIDNGKFTGKIELDILIGDQTDWNKGYGTIALKKMINICFNQQHAERIYLTPRINNNRAIHVYEKVGFKPEGVLRRFEKFEGNWIDCVMMSIIKQEWKNYS
jgi:aminoglycoside 6'-N-acetyltransferase